MACPASGEIRIGKISKELHFNNYNQNNAAPKPQGLTEMSTGVYQNEAINLNNSSANRPNQVAPHEISEFYSYNHDEIGQANQPADGFVFSDIRLKENIIKIGKSKSNIPIYQFNYIGESKKYQGTMAQDLLDMNKINAVKINTNGFYMVDYSKIDVKFSLME